MGRSLTQIRKTMKSSFDDMDKAHKKGNKKAFNKAFKRFDKADKELRKRKGKLVFATPAVSVELARKRKKRKKK